MKRYCTRPARAFLLACLGAGVAAAQAAPGDGSDRFFGNGHWRVAVSPWSVHFAPSEEHKPVVALALEWQRDDDWLWGGSYFTNSFGQPSAYVYLGQRIGHLLEVQPQLFAQWSAGMMYGYRGEYQHKVPFNSNGFSPGLLLSLGWAFDERSSAQINLLGSAGLMLQISYELR
jgi:hypothetical protein